MLLHPVDHTPPLIAAKKGAVGIIIAFLTHGCGDMHRCSHERFWVHLAAMSLFKPDFPWDAAVARHRADMHIADEMGRTPTDAAREKSHGECVAVLEVRHGVERRATSSCPSGPEAHCEPFAILPT
jgi:hypothetical protein